MGLYWPKCSWELLIILHKVPTHYLHFTNLEWNLNDWCLKSSSREHVWWWKMVGWVLPIHASFSRITKVSTWSRKWEWPEKPKNMAQASPWGTKTLHIYLLFEIWGELFCYTNIPLSVWKLLNLWGRASCLLLCWARVFWCRSWEEGTAIFNSRSLLYFKWQMF